MHTTCCWQLLLQYCKYPALISEVWYWLSTDLNQEVGVFSWVSSWDWWGPWERGEERCYHRMWAAQTLRPRQNGRYFPDDIFKCIFLNKNVWIPIKISLNIVPKDPINNMPALVQLMAWRCPGDKPLSEPMMVGLLMHLCITRPQWVNEV